MANNNRNQNQQSQQVAVLEPPRMQMPAEALEIDPTMNEAVWRATIDAVFPLAKSVGAVLMALAYAKKNNVDIFKRMIHIVPMRVGNRTVETVWPGIGLQRVQAMKQDDFAGWDECEFGPDAEHTFKGRKTKWGPDNRPNGFEELEHKMVFPLWAQFTHYKIMHGERIALKGPKTWFMETFSEMASGVAVPNDRWRRAPRQMLEKCAEAASLRRAWPDVFGDEATAEEMDGKELGAGGTVVEGEYVEVTDGGKTDATPRRSDFTEGQANENVEDAEVEEVVDGETGEVTETPKTEGGAAKETEESKPDQETGDAGKAQETGDQGQGDLLGQGSEQETDKDVASWSPTEWKAWAAEAEADLKKAPSIAKLEIAVARHDAIFQVAPPLAREAVEKAYLAHKEKLNGGATS